jgi:putative transcriptional regulator
MIGTEQVVAIRSNLRLEFREFNVERLRAGKNEWTQADLAREAGLAESVVSAFMTDQVKRVDLVTLDRLCRVMDCEPGDLLKRVKDEAPADSSTKA